MWILPARRASLLYLLLVALLFIGLTPLCGAADENGFRPIFNGRNLDGWDGNPDQWSVKDGAIVGQTTADKPLKQNTFLIWRAGDVDDFVLRLSYRMHGGNSGVQYRSKEPEKWVVAGYQGDFEAGDGEKGDRYSGILYEERGRGVLAERGQKVVIDEKGQKHPTQFADSKDLQSHIKKQDWNELEITARGNHLIHKINGQMTAECIDNQKDKRAMSGILALQLHQGKPMKVEFRDIRLKRTRLADGRKKIAMVAGKQSHGIGEHEFNAGARLLKKCLDAREDVVAAVYPGGWPKDPTAFDNADSIMLFMDGGTHHPVIQRNRLAEIDQLMKRGVGLACVHYAVEVPREKGGPDLLQWIGGYYETGYSINPTWLGEFNAFPEHPITRGVKPFAIEDEWYYNMRFPDGSQKVTTILETVPPDDTRRTPAAKEHPGRKEVLAWAVEREDGGRGFGFTGAHFHKNWANDSFRKLILNALLWTAKAEVPPDGVECSVSADDLAKNLDPKVRRKK